MNTGLFEISKGIRRLLAPNPSMMTGPGTNTYLLGERAIAVLDPGPAIASHIAAIQALAGAPVRWIIVTHTHPDHSPAAAKLAAATGAQCSGMPAPEGEHQDKTFVPQRILADGERFTTDEFSLQVVHTPGHASNHLCYRHEQQNWLFTGDHVIDGSTVVINPPDGNMSQYMNSLRRVRSLACDAILPGHGEPINDPAAVLDWTIEHRLAREQTVVSALRQHPGKSSAELVPLVYRDVDRKLYGWAERSLLAHLIKLEEDGVAAEENHHWRPR